MTHDVSIVVISHNEEKNIEDCLSSLVSLDYPDGKYEIILVDSSSDQTKNIAEKFASVKLIASEFKEFAPKRNIGIASSQYDLIAFIDADCIVPKTWLSQIIRKLDDEKVAAVAGNAFPPPNSPLFGKLIACLGKPAGGAIGFDSYALKLENGINVVATTSTIFKKNVLNLIGGFDNKKKFAAGGEDWNLSHKIRKSGFVLEFDPDVTVYHKTRNLASFLKWSFRHGKAQNLFYDSKKSLFWLLINPFSFIWPLIIFLIMLRFPFIFFFILGALCLINTVLAILVRKKDVRHSSIRKLRLLIERRKRIGVNIFHIFGIVIPLYFLDKVIINIGQLFSKFLESFIYSRTIYRSSTKDGA